MTPLNELTDLELLNLFEIVCKYTQYDPVGRYAEYEKFYGFCGDEIKDLIKNRLHYLNELENTLKNTAKLCQEYVPVTI